MGQVTTTNNSNNNVTVTEEVVNLALSYTDMQMIAWGKDEVAGVINFTLLEHTDTDTYVTADQVSDELAQLYVSEFTSWRFGLSNNDLLSIFEDDYNYKVAQLLGNDFRAQEWHGYNTTQESDEFNTEVNEWLQTLDPTLPYLSF
jgi:hypothetical protein